MQISVKAKEKEEKASRALSLSRSATAPSRREPWVGAIFDFMPQKTKDKIKASKSKVCVFAFCGSAARKHEPFREEGVTRRRDGRSPRDWRAANFSFFAPQFVPAKAALFLRGELSAERLTEGCWGSAESGFVPHNRE